jgi:hypothetical protein
MAATMPVGGNPPSVLTATFPNLEDTFRNSRQLTTQAAGIVLILSLLLGVLADVLFLGVPLGLNAPIWTSALLLSLVLMRLRVGLRIGRFQAVCLAGSALLSATIAWRASDTLVAFNSLAAAALFVLTLALSQGADLRRMSPLRYLEIGILGLFELVAGPVAVAFMDCWREQKRRIESQDLQYLGRAVLVSTILILVFGGLFVAADAVVEAEVSRLANINLSRVGQHLLVVTAAAWLAAGAFWGFVAVEPKPAASLELGASWRIRAAENAIILGSLTLIFALFVIVQVRYLFGGEDVVLTSIDLTYAEYARRGFFELVVVAALLLPVLLTLDWARVRTRLTTHIFRGLTALLVVLLFAVMASALQRLRIYEQAFGLTETRLYAATALLWLGTVFAWFLWTITKAQRESLAIGILATAVVALMTLNVLNPDGFIATTNTARLSSGKTFDAEYALSLSADAVPTLVENLNRLPPDDACVVAKGLLNRWSNKDGFRSWNLGRERAVETVRAHRQELDAACSQVAR